MKMNQSMLYMRYLSLVVLLLVSFVSFGQAPSNYTNINGRYRWIAGMFDSTFHIPKGSTPSLRTGGSTNSGGLFYNTSDSSVYTYTGTQWIKLRGSINPSDTTNKYVTQVYKKNASDSVFYVKGGNHLFAFIDSVGSPGGGGGGKVYYFNGGVSMGTFGGFAMYELGDTANTGAAANFTRSTTGNIANFITDPGKPGLLQIPAGVWSVDAWLSETGGGANHAEIWVEVEKWDGSTITTIATSPIEQITEGGTPNLYSWSVSIPTTSLTVTDRIIIQFYISNTNGKTVTLYTQNGYVGEVHTTFTTGIGAINGLTAPAQYLVTGTSGTDFNINSSTATHTFNLPTASATNRGALSTTDWSTFNNKIGGSLVSGYLTKATGTNTIDTSQFFQNGQNVGLGTIVPDGRLAIVDTGGFALKINYNSASTDANNNAALYAENNGLSSYVAILNEKTTNNTGGQYPILIESSLTSGTAQSGMATGIHFGVPDDAGNRKVTQLALRTTDPAAATYTNRAELRLWNNGSLSTPYYLLGNGNMGLGTSTPDSNLTVVNGALFQRGVRMSALPTGVGTKAVRIDANGTLSVADTLANPISGTGTTNYVTKWTSSSAVGNSQIFDNGTNVGIGTNTPTRTLDVNGIITTNNNLELTSANPTILWTTSNLRFYNNTNGVVATISSAGQLSLSSIPNATTDTDKFLVSDGGVVKYRTGSEVLSDIGAASSSSISGTTNYIPKFTSSSAIGNSLVYETGSHIVINGTTNGTALNTSVTVNDPTAGNYSGFIPMTNNVQRGYYGGTSTGLEIGTGGIFTIWTGGSERMRLDASGNLGLGTSSPTFSSGGGLQIANSTAAVLRLSRGANTGFDLIQGATENYIYGRDNFPIIFGTNNTERMRLDASGNLGLGVTPSAWSGVSNVLQVGAGGLTSSFFNSGTDGMHLASNAFFDVSTYKYIVNGTATIFRSAQGQFRWLQAPSGTAGNAISFTQAMTLDASGNLRLGTTSHLLASNRRMTVLGTAGIEAVATGTSGEPTIEMWQQHTSGNNIFAALFTEATTTARGELLYDRTNNALALNGTNALGLRTGNSTRLFINSSGNVGIGTTSPTAKLHINDGTNTNLRMYGSSGVFVVSAENDAGSAQIPLNFNNAMRITSGGNLLLATTTDNGARLNINGNAAVSNNNAWCGVPTTGGFTALIGLDNNNKTQLGTTTNGSVMTLTGNNVGIGTTSPAYTLHVDRGASSGFATQIGRASGSSFYSYHDASGSYWSTDVSLNNAIGMVGASNFMLFNTNGSERMRITSGGELLINTTSDAGDYKLQVNGNGYFSGNAAAVQSVEITNASASGFSGLVLANTGTSGRTYTLGLGGNTSGQNGNFYIYDNTASATRFLINSSGNAEFGGSIKTAAPSGGTAAAWKLGERVASAGVTFNDQQYIQLDIGGTLYYLATVDLPMPEAYPQATSGPSNNYKMAPVQIKTTRDAEIEKLRKEIEELKQLIKNK